MQAVTSADEDLRRLERVARNRLSLWTALVMAFLGLAAFVVLFNLLPDLGDNASAGALILLGLVISLVPALLWLGFFYRLDRLEPEPKPLVVSLFVLGALVTAALHGPVLQGLFAIDSWLYTRWWTRLLGGILVVGFFEQYLIYLTVRYGIFTNPEYDERVDGVIYSMAAGLGLATVLNFSYVIARGGVDLDIGSIRVVVNALAFASFAGIQGYFMGQSRFETTPFYYLPLGLSLAALVNGLFFFVLDQLPGGFSTHPWRDLILAALLALASLAIVFWLVGRANEEMMRLARQQLALP
ncbi:MAG TPA: PrsW family glutamic-type intramembrane protease, partial [Caldilineaceae bacterium]|nr:PrsW family glutamic-type intramembrane protease [Caldilineaceae bacterium]